MPNWGPSGETVFERTYQRTNPDGTRETWEETVTRVISGNLSLVYGDRSEWSAEVEAEFDALYRMMGDFRIIPAGRHLWASGVPGRQYLFNCHVAGWGPKFSDHYHFEFMRLMEGGGVGGNYSSHHLEKYGAPRGHYRVHIVCDPDHPDYAKMRDAGVLSSEFAHDWAGAYPVEDSREGWATALVDLLDVYMTDDPVKHPDRVYDVSRVRPEGAPLRTFGGTASGPLPFGRMLVNVSAILNGSPEWQQGSELRDAVTPLEAMGIAHEVGACVVAGGVRRSARMSMVRWDDPSIMDFIGCKSDPSEHWTTNISIEIDAEFTAAVSEIGFTGTGVENADPVTPEGRAEWARRVFRAAVEGMLTNGEPGFWNSTLNNVGEPVEVICCNPCGEVSLTPWENCNLGHVNLDSFAPQVPGGSVDWDGLFTAHRLMTRFLIRATFGDVTDPKQAEVLKRQRRIGVGHFGFQGFLVKNGVRFSDAPDAKIEGVSVKWILRTLRDSVRDEARKYAFQLRIPEPVKTTTEAPTGSIAKLAGRTEGIHPLLFRRFIRRIRFSTVDPLQLDRLTEFAAEGYHMEPDRSAANTMVVEFPTTELLVAEVEALGLDPLELVEAADEISLNDMLRVQALIQTEYADNAVSFTANVAAEPHQEAALLEGALRPPGPSPERVTEVSEVLARWLPRLKGTTLMLDGSRPQAPYQRLTEAEWASITGPTSVADSVDEECANGSCPVR
ncbi:ribonucleoside-triphosphate reductase, adenosylcobalamin-dependent [Micromonospora sp. PSH03]|uniref:ribonucleoside-triphosphate reductase, adenosylcobalamin-dependent n=1 Tax=Micromonospora salmantinae TaxID=2911211 RepID=UPI001EE992B6|nr:ribonucleoside-triphosphate reductase, adenosylcobalamin-dependent [Micromonospora salmantinae]MCG5459608.1 ribonucleoside-triphosphate reductase, adenosylcobalamin-dependent [Micromonospora salmantinae]